MKLAVTLALGFGVITMGVLVLVRSYPWQFALLVAVAVAVLVFAGARAVRRLHRLYTAPPLLVGRARDEDSRKG